MLTVSVSRQFNLNNTPIFYVTYHKSEINRQELWNSKSDI